MLRAPRSRVVVSCLFACWLAVAMGTAVQARQASWEMRLAAAKAEVQAIAPTVSHWKSQASWGLTLLVVVVSAGAIAAMLQLTQKTWARAAAAVCGAVVSAATVLATSALESDFRTMDKRAREGRRLMQAAQGWIDRYPEFTTDSDREVVFQEIQKRLKQFDALTPAEPGERQARARRLPFETVLHAQTGSCGCLKMPKGSGAYSYHCGTGRADSMTAARALATDQAVAAAVESLQKKADTRDLGLSGEGLTTYVRRSAVEVDSCAAGSGGQASFSILIRLSTALTGAKAQVAFAESDPATSVPNAAGQLSYQPSSSRRQIVEVTVQSNPPKYGDFVFALRESRETRSLILTGIDVRGDGSVGKTKWRFAFFVNGRVTGTLPATDYDDDRERAHVPFTPSNRVELPVPDAAHITIHGYRVK